MKYLIAITSLLMLGESLMAADPARIQYISSADAGQAVVAGTSTLHDWSAKGNVLKGDAEFIGQWKGSSLAAITLEGLALVIPVDSLKSTEGGGMDKVMYDALNHTTCPTISYNLSKAVLKTAPAKPGSAYHFETTGRLAVAGSAHPVDLDLAVLPLDDGRLTITTSIGLKMTDFAIKPPTALLGVIKSGDAVTVNVRWELTLRPAAARTGR